MDTKQRTGRKPSRRRQAEPVRRRRRPQAPIRREPRQAQEIPEVTYVPPKPINRTRVLLSLATVAAIVAAVTFGMSIFFKVKTVTVTGMEKYSAWQIKEASGIMEGDSLMTFSKARAGGNIRAALPYVKSVRIGRTLPDTVNIEIVEEDVAYSVKASGGGWWLMSASGRILESTDSTAAAKNTVIKGVELDSPAVGMPAVAAQAVAPTETVQTDSEETGATELTAPPVTVTAAQQLETALDILQQLEKNSVIGKISTVDVSNLGRIELWYGDQYQINLGDQNSIAYKISCMAQAISQLADYQSGELDVSFTVWPDQVGYTPFG